jgi:putative (di)nucleoside polyphosphate hydrolase
MIRNAVGAIIFQGTEFLLVHKVKIRSLTNTDGNIKGEWDFPKGGVEKSDKNLEGAILRELEEETGSTDYKIIKQLDEKICFSFTTDFTNKTGYKKQETTMFIVEYVGDRSDLLPKDSEISEIEFLKSDEVFERLTHNDTKKFFTNVLSKCNDV